MAIYEAIRASEGGGLRPRRGREKEKEKNRPRCNLVPPQTGVVGVRRRTQVCRGVEKMYQATNYVRTYYYV